MTFRFAKIASAVAASAFLAGAASAAPVTFVFQGSGNNVLPTNSSTTCFSTDRCTTTGSEAAGFDYSTGGVDLNVVAYSNSTPVTLIQDLSPTISGLGALSPGESSSDDQVQLNSLDGSNVAESLLFTFASSVMLTDIDFNRGDDVNCGAIGSAGGEGACGMFTLFNGATNLGTFNAQDNLDLVTLGLTLAQLTGTTFRVVAAGAGNAGFAIGSITVDQVPLPAALPLFVAGIAGLGFAGRKKKAA